MAEALPTPSSAIPRRRKVLKVEKRVSLRLTRRLDDRDDTAELYIHREEEEDTGKSDGGSKGGEKHDESENELVQAESVSLVLRSRVRGQRCTHPSEQEKRYTVGEHALNFVRAGN